MADYASESGHWYAKDGSPAYTQIGKDGNERPTTLRDARKLELLPSVTTIIGLAAKPGLDAWKEDQTILACLTMPRIEGESEADYIARLKADSRAQAKKARERGTEIHGAIEEGFRMMEDGQTSHNLYFRAAKTTLEVTCGDVRWSAEKSFSNGRYGGKVDLHNDDFLIDIKTTEKDVECLKAWDEHAMQLAAYDNGLGHPGRKCGILYFNANTLASRVIWIGAKELTKGERCFNALVDFYYAKTGLWKPS